MSNRRSNMAEMACFWRDRAPVGSAERQAFSDAAEEYLWAQKWPSGHPEKIKAAMKARRRYVKGRKLQDAREQA